MFTGIVQATGRVREVRAQALDRDFVVDCPPEIAGRLELGASIAMDGVCQTVTDLGPDHFTVHAIAETLRVTTMGGWKAGRAINLEPSLGAGDPLGGHFVQGHVDGTARLLSRESRGQSVTFAFEAEAALVAQLVPKGSIALDGVSLTVGPVIDADRFEVYLIPHTLEVTTLGDRAIGDAVNLETDILGKYILRFLGDRDAGPRIDYAALRRAGFGDAEEGGAS